MADRKELSDGYWLKDGEINKARPYDRADYFWAKISEDGKFWFIIRSGKIKSRIMMRENVEKIVVAALVGWNKKIASALDY